VFGVLVACNGSIRRKDSGEIERLVPQRHFVTMCLSPLYPTFRVDGFFPSSFQAFSSYSHDVIMSTFTPHSLFNLPDKALLVDEFVGRPLSSIRTPALVVDRSRFKANCVRVTKEAKRRGMRFRAHVKSTSLRGTGLMS